MKVDWREYQIWGKTVKIKVVNECINDEQCRVKLLNEKEKIKN